MECYNAEMSRNIVWIESYHNLQRLCKNYVKFGQKQTWLIASCMDSGTVLRTSICHTMGTYVCYFIRENPIIMYNLYSIKCVVSEERFFDDLLWVLC